MLAIIGAFFVVGLAVAMLVSIQACGTISVVQTIKYGSIWTLFPSLVLILTKDMYMTMLAVWIPTFFLINQMKQSVCGTEKPVSK